MDPRFRLLLIGFGAFVLVVLFLVISQNYRRRKGLAALAKEMGFSYEQEATQLLKHFARFRLFHTGSNQRIMNVMKGETGSATVWFLDYSYFTSGRSSTNNEHSICVLCSPDVKLPYFYLRYQMPGVDRVGSFLTKKGVLPVEFGGGDIDFPEDEKFSQTFVLQGKEQDLRPLFDVDLRQHLLRFAETLVEIEGNRDTLLFTTGLPVLPRAAREVIHQATDLFALFSQRTASWKVRTGGYVLSHNLDSPKKESVETKVEERIPLMDFRERAGTEDKGRESSITLKGILLLMGAILAFVGGGIIFAEIQNTLAGWNDPLSSTVIIGLVFLIIGLGIVLQVTIGPALKRLKRRSINRQLEDMKVIGGSAGKRKAGERERGSSS
jgi:hypothetical protein